MHFDDIPVLIFPRDTVYLIIIYPRAPCFEATPLSFFYLNDCAVHLRHPPVRLHCFFCIQSVSCRNNYGRPY